MYKLGLPLLPQELLGYHLGLKVDPHKKSSFWNVRTGKRPQAGYGTQLGKKEYEINSVFRKLKIPINVTQHPLSEFATKQSLSSFISHTIKKDKDLIVILASDVLNGTRKRNGHACVIDRIYPAKNIIRLVDPSPKQPKWREISVDKFVKAMKLHPAGKGRLLELTKI